MASNHTPRSRSGTVASDDNSVVGFRYTARHEDTPPQDEKIPTISVVADERQEPGSPDRSHFQPVQSPVETWVLAQQQQQSQQQPLQKRAQPLQPQPGRSADPVSLSPMARSNLGVPASMSISSVSLPTNGSSLGPKLYLPGNKSPLTAHKGIDSPGVLRRLVLSNPRPTSPRPMSSELPSPAVMRRPASNPVLRSASSVSSFSAMAQMRRSGSRTSLASGRTVRLTSASSDRQARTYSVSSGQYNFGYDYDDADTMGSGFLGKLKNPKHAIAMILVVSIGNWFILFCFAIPFPSSFSTSISSMWVSSIFLFIYLFFF